MRINNNISAMNTYSRLTSAQGAQAKSLEKLSSGLRINRAGDDAAGLAISEKMRGQIKGLNQSVRNAQDGISLIQTAEGALNETHSILNRMRELAVQSSNDTNTNSDRIEIQKEMDQLSTEITRIGNDTQFNTKELLNGDAKAMKFHIGANEGQSMELTVNDMRSKALSVDGVKHEKSLLSGTKELKVATRSTDLTALTVTANADTSFSSGTLTIAVDATVGDLKAALEKEGFEVNLGDTTDLSVKLADGDDSAAFNLVVDGNKVDKEFGINVSTQGAADTAITTIDNAITAVSAERSKLGAVQNRLDHTINNLTATSENLSAAESRIRDVDMAKEMMEFTKNNILNQASTAMLAQANQMPQGVLQLLG